MGGEAKSKPCGLFQYVKCVGGEFPKTYVSYTKEIYALPNENSQTLLKKYLNLSLCVGVSQYTIFHLSNENLALFRGKGTEAFICSYPVREDVQEKF